MWSSPRSTRTPTSTREGHIPGAVALHWKAELQHQVKRDVIEQPEFERLMGSKGITNDTAVVLYGDKNNWFAAYAYWYLKLYGHQDVRIMDGGRQKWADEGRELTTDEPRPWARPTPPSRSTEPMRAWRDDVLGIVNNGGSALVDVRSPQEYSGELIAMPGYEQEGAQRGGPHPRRARSPGRSRSRRTARSSRPTS